MNRLEQRCNGVRQVLDDFNIMYVYLYDTKTNIKICKTKYSIEITNKYTVGIVRSILMIGRLFFNDNLDENDTINLVDKDGFLNSEEDQKEQYMTEIAAGLRQPWEYRVKFFGEDEETAKNMVSDEKGNNEIGY